MSQGTVLVTGRAGGLGVTCAVALARRGFDVYLAVPDHADGDVLAAEAVRAGVKLKLLDLDPADPASVRNGVARVIALAGDIYALVNTADRGLRGYFEDVSEEEIRGLFERNLFETMRIIRAVLPHMRRLRTGRIVLISSDAGRIGSLAQSGYVATKFALEGFAESLFPEVLPFGIYVCLVETGFPTLWSAGDLSDVARGATNPASPYYHWFAEVKALAERKQAPPARAEAVARAVVRAIEAPRPRLRYVVGWRTDLEILLRRYLPNPLFERLWFGRAIRRTTRAGLRPDR